MSRYRKSWTQILHEVYCACKDCQCDPCECSEPGIDFPEGHEPQGIDDQYIEESAGLQLKMAFDDAGIKIKGVKNGKLVIAKKDMKKVEKIIAKQMKKPSDAKRVLGSQIVFEDNAKVLHKAIGDDELKVPAAADAGEEEEESYEYDGKVVKISKKDFSKVHKDFKNSTKGKERMLINDPKTGGSISVPVKFEEVELSEKEAAYPSTIENLKKIVKEKQNQIFAFKAGGSIRVDLFSASALVQVYNALKPATKKKFEEMIKTKEGFVKSVDFAFSMAKK